MEAIYVLLALALLYGSTAAENRPKAEQPFIHQSEWQLVQNRWDDEAERQFGLGRGMGRQLMTQEEWAEHRQKMQSLNPEERERYRQEWHTKMVERAHERGITMPATPGPRRERGQRGMGRGRGMGPGGR